MMGAMGASLSAVGGRRAAAAQQVSGHLDALSSPQGLGLGGGISRGFAGARSLHRTGAGSSVAHRRSRSPGSRCGTGTVTPGRPVDLRWCCGPCLLQPSQGEKDTRNLVNEACACSHRVSLELITHRTTHTALCLYETLFSRLRLPLILVRCFQNFHLVENQSMCL